MAKRLFDVACAAVALVALSPVLLLAALGIRLTDKSGPVLFRARRVGYLGRQFTMYKFRTMRASSNGGGGARITGAGDSRITPFGHFLRRTKIDELPQLFNVLIGDMAVVGPRPEDPAIVQQFYSSADLETLGVRPGMASPGSIYQYTTGDQLLAGGDPEASYVEKLLKTKLALDRVYVRRTSLRQDLAIIGRTLWAIGSIAVGKRHFPSPPEMQAAERLLAESRT
jgi:lipopolysaccharide/colanic/teichoic acid biosynthesis glycosyltransferase